MIYARPTKLPPEPANVYRLAGGTRAFSNIGAAWFTGTPTCFCSSHTKVKYDSTNKLEHGLPLRPTGSNSSRFLGSFIAIFCLEANLFRTDSAVYRLPHKHHSRHELSPARPKPGKIALSTIIVPFPCVSRTQRKSKRPSTVAVVLPHDPAEMPRTNASNSSAIVICRSCAAALSLPPNRSARCGFYRHSPRPALNGDAAGPPKTRRAEPHTSSRSEIAPEFLVDTRKRTQSGTIP